jgi:hypothetical protein
MIGKIPKAGRGFKGIVSYLMNGARKPERQNALQPELPDANERQTNARTPERANANRNRVLWTETHNLVTTDPAKAVRVMRATANLSRRCQSPVYHFVISWTPDEAPDTTVMRKIVSDTCRDMGLDDHQRIAIAHDDTRHKHVHVVINRVHHETGKAWNRKQDWVRLEQSLARQAKVRGLRYVPGRHNAPDVFQQQVKKVPDTELQRARRKRLPTPLLQWSASRVAAERKRIADLFDTATSWQQVHAALGEMGLSLKEKGQGHVLHDGTSEVKLSKISKTARVATLSTRFGTPYLPSTEHPLRRPTHPRHDRLLQSDQKPRAVDRKPVAPDRYSEHPQLKPPNPSPTPPSKVDQHKPVNEHKRIDKKPSTSDAPAPAQKRKRRKLKGPKL